MTGHDVLLAGELRNPERVDHVVAREREQPRAGSTGMCISFAVKNPAPLSVYSYCQNHWRAVDVDVDDVRALGDLREVEDRGDGRHRHHREDQERDDRPADLEDDVAVRLDRAAVVAGPLPESQRHEDRHRRPPRRRSRPRPRRTGSSGRGSCEPPARPDGASSVRCSARCRRSSRARRAIVAVPTVITAPRRSRCMRSNICLPSRSRIVGSASARRLYIGGFAGSQLCDSAAVRAVTGPGGRATPAGAASRDRPARGSRGVYARRAAPPTRGARRCPPGGASRRPGRSRCRAASRARRG